MLDIIQLLPDNVANQIAAGEVVQRPASVVKELLENAIDADAEKIELYVREAGRNLIQVVDDGKGMSPTDARMAFERHATSKIRTTEDIFSIHTKGFRGEALASIAAVSQTELKTKQKEAQVGTLLYMEGGELKFQEPVQMAEGSSVTVKNLFYNVPARRKFLKNNSVEFRHITDEFHRVALTHEDLEFDLFHNDEPIFRLRKGSQMQRIVDVFGRKLQPNLIPVQEDLGWVKISGFAGKPEAAKKSRGEQFFFVNNRFFKSPYLNRAVQDAYEGLLLSGYSPSYFLYLEIAPEKIDVNIHPQKTEVKFEDESLIYALIRSSVKKSLGIYNVAPSLNFDASQPIDSLLSSNAPGVRSSSGMPSVPSDYNPFRDTDSQAADLGFADAGTFTPAAEAAPSRLNLFQDDGFDEDLLRLPNGYWLCNREGKTLMLDPGRMYRLVHTEENTPSKTAAASQKLLFSVEYPLNDMEKVAYRNIKKYLAELGYQCEIRNNTILTVDAIPEGLKESRVPGFLESVLSIEDTESRESFCAAYEEKWKAIHRKSRFDFLYRAEVEKLIRDYSALGFPEFLPDGKRCYIELPLDEFKNRF